MKADLKSFTPTNTKTRDLLLGILFDMIGMLSYVIPFIGEFADVIWAPISGLLMVWLYKGITGKIGGMISVLEELLPGLDFIPTFTLMWIYKYVFNNDEK